MRWSVEFLDEAVAAALAGFSADIRAGFTRIVRLIKEHGLERVHELYVKHLDGQIWEMRMRGRDDIARAAYVTATGRRVVVVYVFGKKTPRREIEIAIRRPRRLHDSKEHPRQ